MHIVCSFSLFVCVHTVAPTAVQLEFVEALSGAAAVSGTTAITAATTDVGSGPLTVIHGLVSNFLATTDNVDPLCKFGWERRADAATTDNDVLQPGTLPDQTMITCTAAADTDEYMHMADYDDDNNKYIYVSADNDHGDAAVGQSVQLDVQGRYDKRS